MATDLCPVYAPFFSAMGCTSAIVFACFGASYGTAKSGVGIMSAGILRPDQLIKSCMPTVMAGIVAIYGLVISLMISSNLSAALRTHPSLPLATAFLHLGGGLAVGLTSLAAGFSVGVVGDAGVRATAQQPRLYVGMMLILIFAEVLGLYGMVVGLLVVSGAGPGGC